jgi:hypothetical protein
VRRAPLLTAVLLLSLLSARAWGQVNDRPFVELEVWTELDPFAADARPVERSVAVGRLLDEAAFVLSGMVYGYSFSYTPGDPARQVAESFELIPRALITRGDPALRVTQTWVDDDLLYARMYYELHPEQVGWFNGWRRASVTTATGTGTAPFILGPLQKTDAYDDAIRAAVRAHARTVVFSRPRLITGAATIADPPMVSIVEGSYTARVTINLVLDEIVPYDTY